jgi:hypothetical protein
MKTPLGEFCTASRIEGRSPEKIAECRPLGSNAREPGGEVFANGKVPGTSSSTFLPLHHGGLPVLGAYSLLAYKPRLEGMSADEYWMK